MAGVAGVAGLAGVAGVAGVAKVAGVTEMTGVTPAWQRHIGDALAHTRIMKIEWRALLGQRRGRGAGPGQDLGRDGERAAMHFYRSCKCLRARRPRVVYVLWRACAGERGSRGAVKTTREAEGCGGGSPHFRGLVPELNLLYILFSS